jgi:Ca2+-binding EF-hand superfamily protein
MINSNKDKIDVEDLIKDFKIININCFSAYLKELYKDLAERSDNKQLGINKITFANYYELPGIIFERLFSVFDKDQNEYLDIHEFHDGMTVLFSESFDKLASFIFEFYDFDKDGLISYEDVRIVLSYVPLNVNMPNNDNGIRLKMEKEEYKDRIESQDELAQLLVNFFQNQEYLDRKQFLNNIENVSSEVFLYIIIFLLEKRPFSKKTLLEFEGQRKYNTLMKMTKTPNINNLKSRLIASPNLYSKFSPSITISKSPYMFKRNLTQRGENENENVDSVFKSNLQNITNTSKIGPSNFLNKLAGKGTNPSTDSRNVLMKYSKANPISTTSSTTTMVNQQNKNEDSPIASGMKTDKSPKKHVNLMKSLQQEKINSMENISSPGGGNLQILNPMDDQQQQQQDENIISTNNTDSNEVNKTPLDFFKLQSRKSIEMEMFIDEDVSAKNVPVFRKNRNNLRKLELPNEPNTPMSVNCNEGNDNKSQLTNVTNVFSFSPNKKNFEDLPITPAIKYQGNNLFLMKKNLQQTGDSHGSGIKFNFISSIEDDSDEEGEEVRFEGYLYKISRKRLKKRYFKLIHKDLYYFRNKEDPTHKGLHNLSGVFIQEGQPLQFQNYYFFSFSMISNHKTRFYYSDNQELYSNWLKMLRKVTGYYNLLEIYDVKEKLGNGKFGLVRMGVHKETGRKVAIKIVNKREMTIQDVELVKTEIEILKVCQHPNIVRLYDVFENAEYIYISNSFKLIYSYGILCGRRFVFVYRKKEI